MNDIVVLQICMIVMIVILGIVLQILLTHKRRLYKLCDLPLQVKWLQRDIDREGILIRALVSEAGKRIVYSPPEPKTEESWALVDKEEEEEEASS